MAVDDLWIFDKLIVSRKLNHVCGPAGVSVPCQGHYVVRPCVNLLGMGRGASIEWLTDNTDHLPPGFFWQEIFVGRHLSIDYTNSVHIRCTEGIQPPGDLTRFSRWYEVSDTPPIPQLVQDIVSRYQNVNIEMIGGQIIEIHLRGNLDFSDGAVDIIPVWRDNVILVPDGYVYTAAPDGERLGFYKRY